MCNMGLLADWALVTSDSIAYAQAQGVVVSAQAAVVTAQTLAAAAATTVTNDDTTVATDLAAPPYNGTAFVPDPSSTTGGILVLTVNALPPGFTVTPVIPAT
jgi:hypothetical protein